jgi:phospholipid transport system substrate-binding protein
MLRTLVISLVVSFAAVAAAAPAPGDTITAFHGVLINNMKNGAKLGCTGRIQALGPAVDTDFDLLYLAQRVLRRQWKDLPAEQQQKFIITFRELVIGTYSSQFANYGGESFTTLATQDLADGNKLVHSTLVTGDRQTVSFDYVVHEVEGQWRIVNVVADGVSDLALRSTQYDRAFKAGGFDGLMKLLNIQIQGNKNAC